MPGSVAAIPPLALLLKSLRRWMLDSRSRWLSLQPPFNWCSEKPVINLSSTAFFVVYSTHSTSITPAQTTLAVVSHPATWPVIDLLTCHALYGRFCVANCFWWASCPTCFHVQASAHATMLRVAAVAPASHPANDMHAANHRTASSRKQNEKVQAPGLLCLGCGVAVLQLAMSLGSLGK